MPGVSSPPDAPARSELVVMATFSTSRIAAMPIVSSLLKPSCAGPLPLPSNAGRSIASPPIMVKFNKAVTGSRHPRAARRRAAVVSRTKPYAAQPNSGPVTTDQTIRLALTDMSGTRYWMSLPKPAHATTAPMQQVTNANMAAGHAKVPSNTSSTKSAAPNGTL